MSDQRFPKRLRLLRADEFERVFAARSSAGDAMLVVYGTANDLGHARLGLTVSRRAGGAAARNRWKRLLREAFRLTQHELPALDLVCIPRAGATPQLRRLMESLPKLVNRVHRQQQPPAGESSRPITPSGKRPT